MIEDRHGTTVTVATHWPGVGRAPSAAFLLVNGGSPEDSAGIRLEAEDVNELVRELLSVKAAIWEATLPEDLREVRKVLQPYYEPGPAAYEIQGPALVATIGKFLSGPSLRTTGPFRFEWCAHSGDHPNDTWLRIGEGDLSALSAPDLANLRQLLTRKEAA